MSGWIKVHHEGEEYSIRLSHIIMVRPYGKCTYVYLSTGSLLLVDECYETVRNYIIDSEAV